MIYKRNANFPYPLLTNDSSTYKNNIFQFNCNIDYKDRKYIFEIECDIGSSYLVNLIKNGIASLLLIVDSTDSQFFILNFKDNDICIRLEISDKYITMRKNTDVQLIIKANTDLTFTNNIDLIDFYDNYKNDIVVNRGNALGFSNIISFNGTMKNPTELFNKKINPNLKSEIAFELDDEFITIIYKKAEYEFNDLPNSRNLNNIYLYIGLYKALCQFIKNNLDDDQRILDINISEELSDLDKKLLMLLQSKQIEFLNEDNIDEVICKMSDNLVEKYNTAIRGLTNGN
jgi:hypothetical protein